MPTFANCTPHWRADAVNWILESHVPPAPPLVSNRPLLGIGLMCVAGTVLPFMNGFGKLLAQDYPPEQIIWARLVSHLLWVMALFVPRIGLALFHTRRPGLQVARSMTMLISTTLFFFALPFIGLAKASVINFVSPFLVMLLAAPMLRERLVLGRFLAVLVGFAGVVLVIRPGADVFQWAAVVIFISAGFYSLYQVLTRMVAADDRPETSILYSVLAGAICMSILMPWSFVMPKTWLHALIMASLGLIGAIGHYCIARALTYADAGVVSPFNYVQLIGAVAVGYALFGDLPDSWTWAGAAVIIAAGLYIGWTESRGTRRTA
jgi:drug/metabolite transporter (DMT)-like permease